MDQKENDARYDAAIDVNIVAIALVENPAQDDALSLLQKALKNRIKVLIPTTVILGAYLVLTRYYRTEKKAVAYRLTQLAKSKNIKWHEIVKRDSIDYILKMASQNKIDSWDAYLISIMEDHKIKTLYTTDTRSFSKFSWLNPVNPISKENWKAYNKWLEKAHA